MLEHVQEPWKDEEFNSGAKTMDDYMFEEQAKVYALAFEQQFHCACFYSYLKLKEQEIRNIGYMADLVSIGMAKNLPQWKKIVVPFKDVY